MNERLKHWDEKFGRGEELHGLASSPPLPAAVGGLAPGLALDLVCDFYFLHRPLFEPIRRAVRPGGLLVAGIHVADAAGRAAPHAFLLAPGELRALVESWGWDVLHGREGSSTESGHHHATAEIVARRPDHSPGGGAA